MRGINLLGKQFDRLNVLRKSSYKNNSSEIHWVCQCSCEGRTISVVCGSDLRSGKTKSCGCLNKEFLSECCPSTTHGLSYSRHYRRWSGIKQRCFNKKCFDFNSYGARGITMCALWIANISAFIEYIETLPNFDKPGMTLDRINNDGNYEPGNLRWATVIEQNNNTSRVLSLEKIEQIKYMLKNSCLSNIKISKICNVCYTSVNKIRRELASARRVQYNPD